MTNKPYHPQDPAIKTPQDRIVRTRLNQIEGLLKRTEDIVESDPAVTMKKKELIAKLKKRQAQLERERGARDGYNKLIDEEKKLMDSLPTRLDGRRVASPQAIKELDRIKKAKKDLWNNFTKEIDPSLYKGPDWVADPCIPCLEDERQKLEELATKGPFDWPTHKPTNMQERMTRRQYIKMLEKRYRRKLTQSELATITRGCVGLTSVELGTNGSPDLSNAYATLPEAKKRAAEMQAECAKKGGEARIFAMFFWPGDIDPNKPMKKDPKTGKIDMSGYPTFPKKPRGKPYEDGSGRRGINFDYGWYDSATDSWWHANHYEPSPDLKPDPNWPGGDDMAYGYAAYDRMKVLRTSTAKFELTNAQGGYWDFDEKVFAVACGKKI